jgi:hypothetical protein
MSEYSEPYKIKDFSGSLFKNDKRDKETSPHAKGSAVIDGVEYWMSAWTNTAKSGQRYQSLSFQRKDEVHNAGMAQTKNEFTKTSPDNFESDSIPF